MLTVLSLHGSGGDLGEAMGRFVVLGAMFGLFGLLCLWERRSSNRAFDGCWRTVCHVLEEHTHQGTVLRGTWKGRPFRAYATSYSLGQYGGTVARYGLAMPVEREGPAWEAERASGPASRGRHLWTVRSDVRSAEEALVEAGLLMAIDQAEQRSVHLRPDTRLRFLPGTSEVIYEDHSGEPPCAEDLVVHLDLVRQALDVHDAMVARTGISGAGRSRPVDDPPLWVAALWFPAGLVSLMTLDRWPWTFAFLPASLAAPFLWRLRAHQTLPAGVRRFGRPTTR